MRFDNHEEIKSLLDRCKSFRTEDKMDEKRVKVSQMGRSPLDQLTGGGGILEFHTGSFIGRVDV